MNAEKQSGMLSQKLDQDEIYHLAVEFRRHFHRCPEISEQEWETQAFITGQLDRYKIPYITVGTGVVAVLGKGEKCVAIRGEMDALPVKEETGLAYASAREGIMHACGHDMHLAMVLAVAVALKKLEAGLDKVVKIIFQPSEEKRPGGARFLLPAVLKPPVPEAIFAQHVYPELPTGSVGIRPGAFFASSDNILFSVEGQGTHAAMPQKGSDPILATACLIQFYQTLITKFRNPFIPAVLSITAVHGGGANNVIPDRVEVRGTMRTHDNALRDRLFAYLDEKSETICGLYACQFKRDRTANGLPVLVNDKNLTTDFIKRASFLIGKENVQLVDPLALGEDFAIYLQHIPGIIWLLGVRPPQAESMPPLHSPKFAPDENAMRTGIKLLLESVLQA